MSRPKEKKPDTLAVITEEDMAEVQAVTTLAAKAGSMPAAAIVERMWRRRRRTVTLDLPPVDDAAGLAAAQAIVVAAAARGELTPQEGLAWANMLDCRRRSLDTIEFETRLQEIEKLNAERVRRDPK